jgi:membrane-associated protein
MEYLGVDLVETIKTIGYAGLAVIVFAETGLFLGFFLPGDSLLFIAGFLASQGFFSPFLLASILFVCAALGNMTGYEFGRRVGPRLFSREDSLLFRKQHVERTKSFYDRYGGKTILLARFIPIVRTFAPILAGVAGMRYASFMAYNVVGGLLWSFGLVYLGYFLGSLVTDIDKYLLPIVLGIIFLSFLPGVFHLYRERREMRAAKETGNTSDING